MNSAATLGGHVPGPTMPVWYAFEISADLLGTRNRLIREVT